LFKKAEKRRDFIHGQQSSFYVLFEKRAKSATLRRNSHRNKENLRGGGRYDWSYCLYWDWLLGADGGVSGPNLLEIKRQIRNMATSAPVSPILRQHHET